MTAHEIVWLDHGREPQNEPNPAYPHGIDIPSPSEPSCRVLLPYPAQRCGIYIVTCRACGFVAGITTAGRVDDPRSIGLPCQRGTLQ